jgi:molecular chaperone DnaK
VSALILKRLKEDAEMALGEPVTDAVITVPAYFDDARRKATQDAGRIAGFNVLRILNEPTAAALAYGVDQTDGTDVGTVLVYDLGGGTFDVTIMKIKNGEYDVVGTDGDRNLGGFDWDNALMRAFNNQFTALGGTDLENDPGLQADLRDKAELAKRTLSMAPKAVTMLSAGGRHEQLSVTREEFETLTADLLDRTRILTEGVLADASLTWAQIDKILLVGGSTRMPMVPDLVRRLSGREPERGVNQDEAVALGAALVALDEEVRTTQAERTAERTGGTDVDLLKAAPGEGLARLTGGKVKSIRDVTSQSLGIALFRLNTDDKYNSIVIERNTTIPCRKNDRIQTREDFQTRLRVEVTEGDDEDLEYVTVIGESTLRMPAYPKGAPLEVFYSYDIDGIVHVEVKDLTTGEWLGEFDVERPHSMKDEEREVMTDSVARTAAL